jgi:hypothetical protein
MVLSFDMSGLSVSLLSVMHASASVVVGLFLRYFDNDNWLLAAFGTAVGLGLADAL